MTPNVDERLASVIRSLSEVVLPHLPPEASLAQEQVHLAIGHLQVLRLQFDDIPAYEAEERADAAALASALVAAVTGGEATSRAAGELALAVQAADGSGGRSELSLLNKGIERLVAAVSADGADGARQALSRLIIDHERRRVLKDRRWFAPFGFDTEVGNA